jgi:uroporphyrinogen decarboxylase
MISRERVLAALDHRQPDRIPVDFSAHRSSGIAALAYPKLRAHLNLKPKPVRVYDLVQQLAVVDDDVLDRFRVDTIELGRGFLLEPGDWKDWVLPDGTPCQIPHYVHLEKRANNWHVFSEDGRELGVQKQGWLYFEQTYYPLKERPIAQDDFSDLKDIINHTLWTGVPSPGGHLPLNQTGLAEMKNKAKSLRNATERAIVGLFGGNMFELPQWLYGMDNYFAALKLFPEGVLRLSEKLCAFHLDNLDKWLGAVGEFIDVIVFGDDLGGQNGLLVSPEMYRKYFKPFHKQLWNRAKELADVKVLLHCCGDVSSLIPDLIDAGLDAINPVQISCPGMDSARLKSQFGGHLTFWGGGCDTRFMLPSSTQEEIQKHVKEQIKIFGADGGFIFQQVHNILADVPIHNVVAMFEAVFDSA